MPAANAYIYLEARFSACLKSRELQLLEEYMFVLLVPHDSNDSWEADKGVLSVILFL